VEQWSKEVDGSFTKLEPTFHDMIAFESTARETYARFQPGDSFVASGYVHEYEVERAGGCEIKEEFVARKIGHNANKTRYEVQRRRLAPTAQTGAPPAGRQPSNPAIGF
jgi:single-strand DNA-binding protein